MFNPLWVKTHLFLTRLYTDFYRIYLVPKIAWRIVKAMNIRPLHDRVLIKRVDEETKTAGGIVLPGTAAEKPSRGTVLAVGRGKLLSNGDVRPLTVQVGDHILFGKYSGNEVKIDGDEYIVMREDEIMAILDN